MKLKILYKKLIIKGQLSNKNKFGILIFYNG